MSSLLDAYYRVAGDGQTVPSTMALRNSGGNFSQNVDGSTNPVDFVLGPLENQALTLKSLILFISDLEEPNPLGYGSLRPGLVNNGTRFFMQLNGVETIIGSTLVNNLDIHAATLRPGTVMHNGDNLSVIEMDLENIVLVGNDRVGVRVSDNLTTLSLQAAYVKTTITPARLTRG